jgi:hypothetical protein
MSITNFIPTIWSARLLAALDESLVYSQPGVVNRDYEGDIGAVGDQVRINSIGDPTISNYSRNADINSPEELNSAQQVLAIDQGKYFNFAVDDVDQVQARPLIMDEAMRRAGFKLMQTADQYVAALMVANVPSANQLGSEASPKTDLGTAGNAYQYLVDLGVMLDENVTPQAGRWAIVPPWFHGLLLKDSRFVAAGTPTTDAVLRNGMIGEAAGFRVMKSNNVPYTTTTTKFKIMAGYGGATSFVQQVLNVEAYRPQLRFSDAVKGLHVYGAKVIRPSNIAMLVANRP